MLLWVASFPRSGSALTRTILWQCFGLHVSQGSPPRPGREAPPQSDAKIVVETPAVATAGKPPSKADDMTAFIGPRRFGPHVTLDEMIAEAERSEDLIPIKTHALPWELPRPEAPAIVIVRDGRPVMTSFARFRTEVSQIETRVREVIRGEPRDWSEHVTAWLDHPVPKLLLRYEDLRVAKQETLDAIGVFLGRPQIGRFTATVEDLRAARPTHVRVATNEPGIEEIEARHARPFWKRHGAAMERLGYPR